jgi:hypothetical protein
MLFLLKLFIFVLILITLVVLSIFIDGVLELHKQEKEDKKISSEVEWKDIWTKRLDLGM